MAVCLSGFSLFLILFFFFTKIEDSRDYVLEPSWILNFILVKFSYLNCYTVSKREKNVLSEFPFRLSISYLEDRSGYRLLHNCNL